jgi:hypothetical protein
MFVPAANKEQSEGFSISESQKIYLHPTCTIIVNESQIHERSKTNLT